MICFIIIHLAYLFLYLSSLYLTGHHECEILDVEPEAEVEAGLTRWQKCEKNPGHKNFIPAKDFVDNYLPKVHSDNQRNRVQAAFDLTVKLKIKGTSSERPDVYPFYVDRKKNPTRLGTGFIRCISDPEPDNPCVVYKTWRVLIRTARHNVFNTEEAKLTEVHLFYDERNCRSDGRMKVMTGLEVEMVEPDKDACRMVCVTHDEALASRIKSAARCWWTGRGPLDLSGLDILPPCDIGFHNTLIVSHPHGQTKKITLGKAREEEDNLQETYNTPTCPGSSGAPMFWIYTHPGDKRYYLFPIIHAGNFDLKSTQHQDQLNIQEFWGRETKELNYGHVSGKVDTKELLHSILPD